MKKVDLILGDCVEVMRKLSESSIDLTVTSPPYDNLRTYAGTLRWGEHIWKPVLSELFRLTKPGGVVVWVVNDATINGSETGTSFKQALYAMECGFRLHDTMIYHKQNYVPLTHRRYEQEFEYMFVLVKGKLSVFNPLHVPCKTAGAETAGRTFYQTKAQDRPTQAHSRACVKPTKQRGNVWRVSVNSGAKGHPAPFPEALANDHILSWSNPGDVVLDPFMGSGTTGKMAVLNGRHFIGVEKVPEYFEMAEKRINEVNR